MAMAVAIVYSLLLLLLLLPPPPLVLLLLLLFALLPRREYGGLFTIASAAVLASGVYVAHPWPAIGQTNMANRARTRYNRFSGSDSADRGRRAHVPVLGLRERHFPARGTRGGDCLLRGRG